MAPFLHISSSPLLTSETDGKYANVKWEELGFALIPTDYMYVAKCKQGQNFSEGKVVPYGDNSVSPCSAILNYGQGLFEGLKAYRTGEGRIRLFRPDQNALRMQTGADRLCMTSPSVGTRFDGSGFRPLSGEDIHRNDRFLGTLLTLS